MVNHSFSPVKFQTRSAACIAVTFLFLIASCTNSKNHSETIVTTAPSNPPAEIDSASLIGRNATASKVLCDSMVFVPIQKELELTMPQNHVSFFRKNQQYQLVFYQTGPIFANNVRDALFLVYCKPQGNIALIVYDQTQEKYNNLFADFVVRDLLEDADCRVGRFNPIEDLANELTRSCNGILTTWNSQFRPVMIKITDVKSDSEIVLNEGCLAPGYPNRKSLSICISTSFVYNNWECLEFDADEKVFNHFFSQAFAD